MGSKFASQKLSVAVAAASWAGAVLLAQSPLSGIDAGSAVRDLEQRIELRLEQRQSRPTPADPQPPEDDSFEPWELVSV